MAQFKVGQLVKILPLPGRAPGRRGSKAEESVIIALNVKMRGKSRFPKPYHAVSVFGVPSRSTPPGWAISHTMLVSLKLAPDKVQTKEKGLK